MKFGARIALLLSGLPSAKRQNPALILCTEYIACASPQAAESRFKHFETSPAIPRHSPPAAAVQHGDVDAPVLIARRKGDLVCLVEQVGVKDHRPVGTIRHANLAGAILGQEIIGRAFIGIELGEIPFQGGFFIPCLLYTSDAADE